MCCGKCKPGCCAGPCGKDKYWQEIAMFLRKYHAYYIAYGVTNDWYYHPMEASPGHLTGILNDLLFFW
jgi:hypothetical protein